MKEIIEQYGNGFLAAGVCIALTGMCVRLFQENGALYLLVKDYLQMICG